MSAQNDIYVEKTKTIDSTIEVLYEVILWRQRCRKRLGLIFKSFS